MPFHQKRGQGNYDEEEAVYCTRSKHSGGNFINIDHYDDNMI